DEQTKTVFNNNLSSIISESGLVCLTGARCGFERKVQLNIDSTTVLGSNTQLVLIQDAQEPAKQYTQAN
ncbi:c-di-GMP phosphodiesterase, partial [Vibrio lentus]